MTDDRWDETDVCIEYAHVHIGNDGAFDVKMLQPTAQLAWALSDAFDRLGLKSRRVILFDDDLVLANRIEPAVERLLTELGPQFGPDYLCFEKELRSCRDSLRLIFGESLSRKFIEGAERYYERHGCYACSRNIALWHLYRLGYLTCSSNTLCRKFVSKHAYEVANLGAAKVIVSILHSVFADGEKRADREVLSLCKVPLSNRILRLYISEQGERESREAEIVDDVRKRVNGMISS